MSDKIYLLKRTKKYSACFVRYLSRILTKYFGQNKCESDSSNLIFAFTSKYNQVLHLFVYFMHTTQLIHNTKLMYVSNYLPFSHLLPVLPAGQRHLPFDGSQWISPSQSHSCSQLSPYFPCEHSSMNRIKYVGQYVGVF